MRKCLSAILMCLLVACATPSARVHTPEFFGTVEPFASEAIYFVVTDRFVDGDPSNNYEEQGGNELYTFDRPVKLEGLPPGNIGYLGGDFRGVLNNAAYIADMGFTAIWLTPIVDNPDEAFTGGKAPGEGGSNDLGKTGYHGYWGVNFFQLDEHLPSSGLGYGELTAALAAGYGIKTVLDVVCNHGSPSFSMVRDQPKYGEIYGPDGELLADHQNLHPSELDDDNPLHDFYLRQPDLAELSDMDYDNPKVLDYFVEAYLKWIDQGAAALRIDTIKHMPHEFWKAFSDRIRAEHPGLFMFAESWSFDAKFLASHQETANGNISVLDFPGREAMLAVFGSEQDSYERLLSYLHLDTDVYRNPYELMTFYDNHDMSRLDADDHGFVDANNWLFTSRGIPVVYYGSEVGFRAGADQHSGNRDYFGQDNIDAAPSHSIHQSLRRIATVRKNSIALQRGLQLNYSFTQDTAIFLRAYQGNDSRQSALVFLNKGNTEKSMTVSRDLEVGKWKDAITGDEYVVSADDGKLAVSVPAHGVRVLMFESPLQNPELISKLLDLQRHTNLE
ncbi:MAG: alpha-amylase family glycosyl hydrolase [Pseudomonadota bacterium]